MKIFNLSRDLHHQLKIVLQAPFRAITLLVVGLFQLTGILFSIPAMQGVGMASCASPAPKVFTVSKGLETFSTDFVIEWSDFDDKSHSLKLDSTLYGQICGPYNRRNIYGALFAYGPILASEPATQPLFNDVCRYALSSEGPLLRELGIDPYSIKGSIYVCLLPKARCSNPALPMVLEVRR